MNAAFAMVTARLNPSVKIIKAPCLRPSQVFKKEKLCLYLKLYFLLQYLELQSLLLSVVLDLSATVYFWTLKPILSLPTPPSTMSRC